MRPDELVSEKGNPGLLVPEFGYQPGLLTIRRASRDVPLRTQSSLLLVRSITVAMLEVERS